MQYFINLQYLLQNFRSKHLLQHLRRLQYFTILLDSALLISPWFWKKCHRYYPWMLQASIIIIHELTWENFDHVHFTCLVFITFKNLNIYGISKTIIFSVLHERINRETAIITQHVVNVFVELVNMPIFLLHIYFDHAHNYEYSII